MNVEMKTSVAKANDSFPSDDDALDEPQLLALLEEAESKMQKQKQTVQTSTFFSFYFECYNERNVAFARFEHNFKIGCWNCLMNLSQNMQSLKLF